MTTNATPDTIVLIHGLWMTPRSWEHWIAYYEAKGYTVLAPAYPGFEVEVEALRADTTPISTATVPETLEHLENVINAVEKPPIIIGHSFGGLLVQLLLDRGYACAGVAIDSVPSEGVLLNPLSQIKALFPVLSHPEKFHKTADFTPEQFYFAFTNVMTEEESRVVYDRYYIPAPGTFVWGGVLANVLPGHQDPYVNFNNDERAPLLFIAGGSDNIMPAAVNKSNADHYKSKAVTDFHEFPARCHFTCGQEGWEAVADYALDWALKAAQI